MARMYHADIFCSSLSPNAGHTYREYDGTRIMVKQIPVGLTITRRSMAYLTAGSIIEPISFLAELDAYGIDHDRVIIHPAAAVVSADDINSEANPSSSYARIASTASGTGSALSAKIMRAATLAGQHTLLAPFCKPFDLSWHLGQGCSAIMETAQGFSLGINAGFYPYCTSRDISVSQALSDARLHPSYLGDTIMSLRTYPIRVGNTANRTSGPFYPDSEETSWEALKQIPELTTVTKRVRRVATFSEQQFKDAAAIIRPDHVFLNFLNYASTRKELSMYARILKGYDVLVGTGPCLEDVHHIGSAQGIRTYTGLFS